MDETKPKLTINGVEVALNGTPVITHESWTKFSRSLLYQGELTFDLTIEPGLKEHMQPPRELVFLVGEEKFPMKILSAKEGKSDDGTITLEMELEKLPNE